MRADAAERGWSVLEAVSNQDDNRQYQQVLSMIRRRVDGIIIVHSNEQAVIPAIRAANAAEVPMVHFNRAPAASDAYSVAVVADNRQIMRDAVLELLRMARVRGGRYKAGILIGDLGDANAVLRRDGFLDAVRQNTDIVEVATQIPTEWNADRAFAGLTNALQAHPDLNMLVSSSDFLIPQIEQALRTAGKWKRAEEPGHVMIASLDGDAGAYQQLADGYFDVDGVQNLFLETRLSFDALERMWRGERPPRTLLDPGLVITRETLAEKREEMWGYHAWRAEHAQPSGGEPALGAASEANGGASSAVSSSGLGAFSWAALAATAAAFFQAAFTPATAVDIGVAMLPLAILVTGQMLVMLLGQIDLSMTAVMSMASIVSAALMTSLAVSLGDGGASVLGVLVCLLVGAVIGAFNGVCVALLRMPSFIATLAVMMLGGGLAVWFASTVSDTVTIGNLPASFRALGYGGVFGIPYALLIALVVLGAIAFALKRTLYGRWLFAIGHNHEAARISGVPVAVMTIGAFAASGLLAGLASAIYTARIETGTPTLGQNMLLDIVGAAVIGGVSLFGGRGGIVLAVAGALFLTVLDKSLQLLGLSLFVVLAVKGAAILIAALADVRRRRKEGVA
jgi:ribose/xylose/arabinose/galactoside ABC-type transport system permease subunit/ABC-type sugar transport system substrate-binding protein